MQTQLKKAISVRPLPDHGLYIEFEDGQTCTSYIAQKLLNTEVFSVLKDEKEFSRVSVEQRFGSLAWPCGVDLDGYSLYLDMQSDLQNAV